MFNICNIKNWSIQGFPKKDDAKVGGIGFTDGSDDDTKSIGHARNVAVKAADGISGD